MKYRTDLAVERKEMLDEAQGEAGDIDGVLLEKVKYDENVNAVRIKILNAAGEKQMEKPMGNYITLEIDGILEGRKDVKERAGKALAEELKQLIDFHFHLKILVVGLGNGRVTPDSLGPHTVSKVKATRQLFLIFQAEGDEKMSCVSCFVPGVTGATGMEAAELVRGAIALCDPELVIAVDSLAARSLARISTTIQMNDTGISPGGGMGDLRADLSQETLGRRVIAIGVPTVIDSGTLIREALAEHVEEARKIDQYIADRGQDMIVTSTDIDLIIEEFSDILANGINKTLHPGIYS